MGKKRMHPFVATLTEMLPFLDFFPSKEEDWSPPVNVCVLVEIVSAQHLQAPKGVNETDLNPYCLVRTTPPSSPSTTTTTTTTTRRTSNTSRVLHETGVVRKKPNPIWTVKTLSLFLLQGNDEVLREEDLSQGLEFEICHHDDLKALVPGSQTSLGTVRVPLETILNSQGERLEFEVTPPPSDGSSGEDSWNFLISSFASTRAMMTGTPQETNNDVSKETAEEELEAPKKQQLLALRFRPATRDDLAFMQKYHERKHITPTHSTADYFNKISNSRRRSTTRNKRKSITRALAPAAEPPKEPGKYDTSGGPTDFEFTDQSWLSSYNPRSNWRTDRKTGVTSYLVRPFPDPSRPEKETKWMTSEDIERTVLEPSTQWIKAGTGDWGIIHLEILNCDGLPNLDTSLNTADMTDAFAAIVFEDTMVRTHVIQDSLSPRWMPWCQRAFSFPMKHPSSVLTIGVFDHDFDFFDDHDPIGRVVVDYANLMSNTTYLLTYELHSDLDLKDENGKIRIRLRVEWNDERKAMLHSFSSPPVFHINVESRKAFKVLRYLCRGEVNLEKASVKTVSFYFWELVAYWQIYFYAADVLMEVLLWRGRLTLPQSRSTKMIPKMASPVAQDEKEDSKVSLERGSELAAVDASTEDATMVTATASGDGDGENEKRWSIWFPIHSLAFFCGSVLTIERPHYLPSLILFGIAWIMLTIMLSRSRFPMPFRRCKDVREYGSMLLFGASPPPRSEIRPNHGYEDGSKLDALVAARKRRVTLFLYSLMQAALKFRREYNKTDPYAFRIETEDKEWSLFGDKLYYVHLLFYYLAYYHRMVRNVVSWKSSQYSFTVTMFCLGLGIFFLLFPWIWVLRWSLRIVAWTILGPWMKVLDMWFVHKHYRTVEELLADPNVTGPDMSWMFQGEKMDLLAKQVRIAAEDSIKLKHMREETFGAYSERVPPFDSSRYPSVPLPESSARPWCGGEASTTRTRSLLLSSAEPKIIRIPGQRLRGRMVHTSKDRCIIESEEANGQS